MAHWNYRLVRHKNRPGEDPQVWFAVHEVHYDEGEMPAGITAQPVTFGGDTPDEVARALERALRDVRERPVLDALPQGDGERT